MALVGTPGKHEEDEHDGTASFRSRLGPIVLLSLIFFLNFLARIILAPLLPALEQDLHLDHGEAGSLFLLISLGYCTSLLGSGLVSSRLTHRNTIILSAVAAGMPLIALCFGNQLWQVQAALVALGLATGLYLPSGIATITSLIPPRHWGKGIAIHEVAPNLCAVVAPFMSEALLPWVPWWGILALIGAASVIVGIAFWRFGAGGRFPGQAPTLSAFQTLLRERSFWAMTVLLSLAISASLGVYTMFPLYLVAERGIERSWANILVGLSRASGLVAVFLAGWAADRIGPRQIMRWVLLLTGTFTVLLGAVPGYWVAGMFFLQQLLAVCFFPAGFAVLSAIGPPHARNLAVSLSIPIAFLAGGGVTPTIIGVMGDAGSFTGGIVLVGALVLSGFVICLRVKVPGGNGGSARAAHSDAS
ncbi:MAG TPA: MFS transporter [Syntrophobacteria bacterium]|nr:MFS transporter [Syntrophobacteria bacterium]